MSLKAFKQELRDLLAKYDAEIEVDYSSGSDMHGVDQEGISVWFGHYSKNKEYKLTDNEWSLEAGNIRR